MICFNPSFFNHRLAYWSRLLAFFLLTMAVALPATPLLLGAATAVGLVYAPCVGSDQTPTAYGLPWEEVVLSTDAGQPVRGFFIPGDNGAAIIIPPTGAQGRAGRLPEAAMLAQHGYSVLLYESRRCAGMGPISLGYLEVEEVKAAVAYLLARPEVDPDRLGIYGFSTAGATSILAGAQLPQLRAVVAEGGYGDFLTNALRPSERDWLAASFLKLHRLGLAWMYRWLIGLDLNQLSPVSVIDQIAPRPILLIYGSREVSLSGGYAQQAAGPTAELWVVEGAAHGDYRIVAPAAYEQRVVGFFDGALRVGE